MGFIEAILKPADLPYDYDKWKDMSFAEQAKLTCQAWYQQGFGSPISTLMFYLIKLALWIWVFFIFCSYSTELGTFSTFSEWWFTTEAFGKALIWTSLLEVIGLAGASGPLMARFIPPFGGITYFLRPKTIRMSLFPKAPIVGGDTRNIFTVLLYVALLAAYLRACIAPAVTFEYVLPILALLLVNGLFDRTVFLAARGDIYFPLIACYLFADQTVPALKICLFFVWFWAAFSKLTPAFVSVVQVMICNSPFLKYITPLRKALFKDPPNDLRPSTFAKFFAHMGTTTEFVLPILLMFTTFLAPEYILYVVIGITLFHTFIFLNIPMAVPLEWNVIMVYGGWAIFLMHPEVSPFTLSNPYLIGLFAFLFVFVTILGTFWPKYVSFLMSMRYYAGTWAYNIWLFKDDAKLKIDEYIVKTSKSVESQLEVLYDQKTVKEMLSRLMGLRLMHIPSGAVHKIYDKATNGKKGYYWMDGEFFCGEILGWTFGDGHMHDNKLLESIQKRCHYESGEVRVISVESPQMHNGRQHWRIFDAKDGLIDEGYSYVRDYVGKPTWSEH